MDTGFQREIREYELEQIIPLIPEGGSILEIGAGAGWQARKLAEHGFRVTATDVKGSRYESFRVWDVLIYDGKVIPLPDKSIDVVFTSHVLDHLYDHAALQAEMKRILKPGGFAVHVVPTATWRFWTTVTHYPERLKRLMRLFGERLFESKLQDESSDRPGLPKPAPSFRSCIANDLIIPRLGARGNAMTEMWSFARKARETFFQRYGWNITGIRPNLLYYSGNKMLGPTLNLKKRRALSSILGNSSVVYIVEPVDSGSAHVFSID